eukprot:TRINITY_DN8115_c0_g1_i1.p1 TRINITY_DN8115_c0_g1~~TRINITY_DN8115_c0_g1_i1.p1  ORF type:complete len:1081 (+),score=238.79 TRINITY_DN8115_c0_g1_i1:1173-4415(+)
MYEIPLTAEESISARDSLAKHTYRRLFDWIVKTINAGLGSDTPALPRMSTTHDARATIMSLASAKRDAKYIGILDIFGFENNVKHGASNSLEQLCINYCNEKLQGVFDRAIFKQERELYESEGIPAPNVSHETTDAFVELIEAKAGLFALLDEESRLPRATDATFTEKLHRSFAPPMGKAAKSQNPRASVFPPTMAGVSGLSLSQAFALRHYAAPVCYTATGFLTKNVDAIHEDHLDLLSHSSITLLSNLFADSNGAATSKKRSIVSDFQRQLCELIADIERTSCHFVRCLKPNSEQRPDKFCGSMVLSQLRCTGLVAALAVLGGQGGVGGFPCRVSYSLLTERFASLLPQMADSCRSGSDSAHFVSSLLHALGVPESHFRLGVTRAFLSSSASSLIEELCGEIASVSTTEIIDRIRRHMIRSKVRRVLLAVRSACKLVAILHHQMVERRISIALRMTLKLAKLAPIAQRARFHVQTNAAVLIQSVFRAHLQRSRFSSLRSSALSIQAAMRGYLARALTKNLRKQRDGALAAELEKIDADTQAALAEAAAQEAAKMQAAHHVYIDPRPEVAAQEDVIFRESKRRRLSEPGDDNCAVIAVAQEFHREAPRHSAPPRHLEVDFAGVYSQRQTKLDLSMSEPVLDIAITPRGEQTPAALTGKRARARESDIFSIDELEAEILVGARPRKRHSEGSEHFDLSTSVVSAASPMVIEDEVELKPNNPAVEEPAWTQTAATMTDVAQETKPDADSTQWLKRAEERLRAAEEERERQEVWALRLEAQIRQQQTASFILQQQLQAGVQAGLEEKSTLAALAKQVEEKQQQIRELQAHMQSQQAVNQVAAENHIRVLAEHNQLRRIPSAVIQPTGHTAMLQQQELSLRFSEYRRVPRYDFMMNQPAKALVDSTQSSAPVAAQKPVQVAANTHPAVLEYQRLKQLERQQQQQQQQHALPEAITAAQPAPILDLVFSRSVSGHAPPTAAAPTPLQARPMSDTTPVSAPVSAPVSLGSQTPAHSANRISAVATSTPSWIPGSRMPLGPVPTGFVAGGHPNIPGQGAPKPAVPGARQSMLMPPTQTRIPRFGRH